MPDMNTSFSTVKDRLELLQEISLKDVKIDPNNIDVESLRGPEIYCKYLKILSPEKFALSKLKGQLKKLKLELSDYYTGKADPEVYVRKGDIRKKLLRGEVEPHIEADEEYQELESKVEYQNEIVETIKKILSTIENRQWSIKNAIDYLYFTNGKSRN